MGEARADTGDSDHMVTPSGRDAPPQVLISSTAGIKTAEDGLIVVFCSGLKERKDSSMSKKDQDDLVERTRKTAGRLFTGPVKVEVPYELWKAFDPGLARDLSLFITGNLYSREVLELPERQLVAITALAALQRIDELKIHLHGALNVGVPAEKLAEAIFQVGVYAGFPVVNTGLAALKEILESRGQWPPKQERSL